MNIGWYRWKGSWPPRWNELVNSPQWWGWRSNFDWKMDGVFGGFPSDHPERWYFKITGKVAAGLTAYGWWKAEEVCFFFYWKLVLGSLRLHHCDWDFFVASSIGFFSSHRGVATNAFSWDCRVRIPMVRNGEADGIGSRDKKAHRSDIIKADV